MKKVSRTFVVAFAVAVLSFVAPVVWCSFGTHGYFSAGTCSCGFPIYDYIREGWLWDYSPGHGVAGHRMWKLRERAGEWEELDEAGQPVARLKLSGADLYQLYPGYQKWVRYPRVYNVWRIYIARLFFEPPPAKITCANNMKQIGVEMKTWALDHGDQFPFNVSTNAGGTMELCARGPDGFDTNALLHFRALAGDYLLSTPLLLVCPQDHSKRAVTNVALLGIANVSYRLRTDTNVTPDHARAVLLVCPVHGSYVLCDGTFVEPGKTPSIQ